jgi:hypothetical protein
MRSPIVYVLWGRRPDAEAWQEEVLAECPTRADAEAKGATATRNGWHGCRISRMNLAVPPDFSSPSLLNV